MVHVLRLLVCDGVCRVCHGVGQLPDGAHRASHRFRRRFQRIRSRLHLLDGGHRRADGIGDGAGLFRHRLQRIRRFLAYVGQVFKAQPIQTGIHDLVEIHVILSLA